MDRLLRGFEHGEWDPFIAMLTDEFSFWYPADPARGQFEGATGRRVIEEWIGVLIANGSRVVGERRGTTVAGKRVFYELESYGSSPSSEGYRNRELIIFEVRGPRICAMHEFWGDVRPISTP